MPDVNVQIAQVGGARVQALQPQLQQLYTDFRKGLAPPPSTLGPLGPATGAPVNPSAPSTPPATAPNYSPCRSSASASSSGSCNHLSLCGDRHFPYAQARASVTEVCPAHAATQRTKSISPGVSHESVRPSSRLSLLPSSRCPIQRRLTARQGAAGRDRAPHRPHGEECLRRVHQAVF